MPRAFGFTGPPGPAPRAFQQEGARVLVGQCAEPQTSQIDMIGQAMAVTPLSHPRHISSALSLSLSLFRSDFLDTRIHSSSLAWIVGKAMVLYKGCFSRSFFRVYCKAMVPEVFRTNGSKTLSWPTRRQQYGLRPRRHGFPFVLHGLQGHLHSSWATSKNGSAWTNPTLRSVAQTGVLSMV